MLFADELFRWNASFLVRNAEEAEPSDWEIAGRYITWTALPVMAAVIFILGLKYAMEQPGRLSGLLHVIFSRQRKVFIIL